MNASFLTTAELIVERELQRCLNPTAVATLDVEIAHREGTLFTEPDLRELEMLVGAVDIPR